ncbi:hypothetical protein MMC10_005152 [Thelotrema lepadinum]|nr:hypothetical protein [Thelotrema lepadinum]
MRDVIMEESSPEPSSQRHTWREDRQIVLGERDHSGAEEEFIKEEALDDEYSIQEDNDEGISVKEEAEERPYKLRNLEHRGFRVNPAVDNGYFLLSDSSGDTDHLSSKSDEAYSLPSDPSSHADRLSSDYPDDSDGDFWIETGNGQVEANRKLSTPKGKQVARDCRGSNKNGDLKTSARTKTRVDASKIVSSNASSKSLTSASSDDDRDSPIKGTTEQTTKADKNHQSHRVSVNNRSPLANLNEDQQVKAPPATSQNEYTRLPIRDILDPGSQQSNSREASAANEQNDQGDGIAADAVESPGFRRTTGVQANFQLEHALEIEKLKSRVSALKADREMERLKEVKRQLRVVRVEAAAAREDLGNMTEERDEALAKVERLRRQIRDTSANQKASNIQAGKIRKRAPNLPPASALGLASAWGAETQGSWGNLMDGGDHPPKKRKLLISDYKDV